MTIVTDFVIPPIGEAIDSARLVRWAVMPGQPFEDGDIVVEIETDKSIVEVPAPRAGVMVEHLIAVDGLLNADTVIARIQVEGEQGSGAAEVDATSPEAEKRGPVAAIAPPEPVAGRHESGKTEVQSLDQSHRKFSTPAARRLAREHDVAIENIDGTGEGGRVTQADVARAYSTSEKKIAGRNKAGREFFITTLYGDVGVTVWDAASAGHQPTFVLAHGLFGDRNTWTATADVLVRAGLPVVSIDLPCHGRTRSDVTSFRDIVECTAEAVSKACSGGMVLVGHSFGGAVMARVARKPALRVGALVLIAPVGLGSQIEQPFVDGMLYADSDEAMLRELRKLTVSGMTPSIGYVQDLRRAIADRRERIAKLCREVSWNGVQQLDVVPDLAASEHPTVIVQGRRDAVIPWQHILNAPARVALHLLPDAGHMPQWEATTLTTSIIVDAIAR